MGYHMSYFKNIALLKAPLVNDVPQPQFVSDLIEVCGLAAVIEKDVDSVRIPVDFYNDTAYEDFHKYLNNASVDLVGISSITGAFNNAMKLAEMSKKAGKYVVMGGYHPSAMPDEVLKSPYVDAVIIGEGEATFRDFVLNGPSRDVAGMAVKLDGDIVFTGERPLIKDLDTLPFPLRSARPDRFGEAGDDYSIDTVYTSRGCPHQCSFCANNVVHKRWRPRSPEHIIEELTMLHDPNRKKFVKLWDANFLTNVKRIEKLCDLMIEKDLTNFKICIETGVNDILRAEGIMHKLYKAGVRHIAFGIESPNEETLKLMKKKIKGDDCSRAVEILKENKIKSQGYFIIGHYAETEEQTRKYPEYAESLGLRSAVFMVMTPYPGTRICDEYRRKGQIISFNWDLYNNFGTTVRTQHMDERTLKMMHIFCWGKFYIKFAFMNNSKPLGVAMNIIEKMTLMQTFCTIDPANTGADIKEYLFEYLNSSCGEFTRKKPKKNFMILNVFQEFNMRFVHSEDKAVDLRIVPEGDTLRLIIERSDNKTAPKGFSIEIDRIIKLAKSVTSNNLVALSSKIEIAKNNKASVSKHLALAMDRDVRITAWHLASPLLPVVLKGTMNMLAGLVNGRRGHEQQVPAK